MTRLRISGNGTIQGLWTDEVAWQQLGPVQVRRATHIEFDERRQLWYVRLARPRAWWRGVLQAVLRRPCAEILHWSASRAAALARERAFLGAAAHK